MNLKILTRLVCAAGLSLGVAGSLWPANDVTRVPVPESAALEQAHAFYASQPRILRPVPYTRVPAGITDLRAETCGSCHTEIYAEWRISTHARAWKDDAQFMAELEKSGTGGRDVRWMCVNCHTPLENQLETLVTGLIDNRVEAPKLVANPRFDARLQQDAITCASCHVRDGVVLGPFGDTNAPHPVKKEPALLNASACTQCHQAQMNFEQIALACVFNTGAEYSQSPYAQRGDSCQTCHMPAVARGLTPLSPVRHTRRHWFGGSLIPKSPGLAAELKPLEAFYPDGLTVRWVSVPDPLPAGKSIVLKLEMENARAGHALPTGDPERFLLVQAEAFDANGKSIGRREERVGSVFEWWPKVKKLSDNRLLPKEKRQFELPFRVPLTGPVQLKLQASKWRLSAENMKFHHLEGKSVPGRTFLSETKTVRVK